MSQICTKCFKTRALSKFQLGSRVCTVCSAPDTKKTSLYSERPDKFTGATKQRRADMKRRTFPADIYFVRKMLKDRPDGLHADHIVPLNGWTDEGYRVSGLHVSWNIAYLSPEDNDQKGNSMRPGIDHTIGLGGTP